MKNVPGKTPSIVYGACGHPGRTDYASEEDQMATLFAYNLKTYRFDVSPNSAGVISGSFFSPLLTAAAKWDRTLRPIIQIPYFSNFDKTDSGAYANTDAGLYQQAYDRSYAAILAYSAAPYNILVWEFGNELTNKSGVKTGGTFGQNSSDYNNSVGISMRFALQGMSDALQKVKTDTGRAMKSVVGIVGNDFGWTPFLEAGSVVIDVLSYHYYNGRRTNPHTYFAPYGTIDLFTSLAAIGKPIYINEFNAAEIYGPGLSPAVAYVASFAELSMMKHLDYMSSQTQGANIVEIYFYELNDEPGQGVVEGNFGLQTSNGAAPKNQILIAGFYAGARFTAAQLATLKPIIEAWRMTQ